MIIASTYQDIKFHSWPNGQLVNTYKPGKLEGLIQSICWGKDGTWMIVSPYRGCAEIISVKSNSLKLLHSIQEILQPSCAVFSNGNRRFIALGSPSGSVVVYDIKSKTISKRFPVTNSCVFKLEFTAKDTHLVVGCKNGEILLYSNTNTVLSTTYKIHSQIISNFRCHPNRRNLIAGGSTDGTIAAWDLNNSKARCLLKVHNATVTDLAFSPIRSDLVVSSGYDKKFCFYDIVSNKCVNQFTMERSLTAIDFCPQGIGLVVGDQTGNIYTYDTRKMNHSLERIKAHNGPINQILFQKIQQPYLEGTSYELSEELPDSNSTLLNERSAKSCPLNGDGISSISDDVSGCKCSLQMKNSTITTLYHNTTKKNEVNNYIEENIKKSMSSKPSFQSDNIKLHSVSTKQEIASFNPNFIHSELPTGCYAPAPTTSPKCKETSSADKIRKIVKNEVDAMTTDLKYEIMENMSDIRMQMLAMQMSIIKEFVKMEDALHMFRQELMAEVGFSDDVLLQENNTLREENEHLKKILSDNNLL